MPSNAQFPSSATTALVGQLADGVFNVQAQGAITAGDLVVMTEPGKVRSAVAANGIATEGNNTLLSVGQQAGYGGQNIQPARWKPASRVLDDNKVLMLTGDTFVITDIAGNITVPAINVPVSASYTMTPASSQSLVLAGGKFAIAWMEYTGTAPGTVHRIVFAIYKSDGTPVLGVTPITLAATTNINYIANQWMGGTYSLAMLPNGNIVFVFMQGAANQSVNLSTQTFTQAGVSVAFFVGTYASSGAISSSYEPKVGVHPLSTGDFLFSWFYGVTTGYVYTFIGCATISAAAYAAFQTQQQYGASVVNRENFAVEFSNGNIATLSITGVGAYSQNCIVVYAPRLANQVGLYYPNLSGQTLGQGNVNTGASALFKSGPDRAVMICVAPGDLTKTCFVSVNAALSYGVGFDSYGFSSALSGIAATFFSDNTGAVALFDNSGYGVVGTVSSIGQQVIYSNGHSLTANGSNFPTFIQGKTPNAIFGLTSIYGTYRTAYRTLRSSLFGVAQSSANDNEFLPVATRGNFGLKDIHTFSPNSRLSFDHKANVAMGNAGYMIGRTIALTGIPNTSSLTPNAIN